MLHLDPSLQGAAGKVGFGKTVRLTFVQVNNLGDLAILMPALENTVQAALADFRPHRFLTIGVPAHTNTMGNPMDEGLAGFNLTVRKPPLRNPMEAPLDHSRARAQGAFGVGSDHETVKENLGPRFPQAVRSHFQSLLCDHWKDRLTALPWGPEKHPQGDGKRQESCQKQTTKPTKQAGAARRGIFGWNVHHPKKGPLSHAETVEGGKFRVRVGLDAQHPKIGRKVGRPPRARTVQRLQTEGDFPPLV
jgi:hypothetical protein